MRFGVHIPNFGDFHDLRAIAESMSPLSS